MIRIEVSDQSLLTAIRKKKAGWLTTAKAKAAAALQAGKVDEGGGTWSEIKEVFILLQGFKCVYCEFPMPKVDSSSAEKVAVDYDVEHFRPKNRVTPWPSPKDLARRPGIRDYQQEVRSGSPAGYLRLAYDPFNYVVSCKVCNSSYKADRFPIAGKPQTRRKARKTLDPREKPLLLFPFGENADDPGQFLAFLGPTLQALPAAGYERLRAQVVIDFFELDTREGLLEGRCWMIQCLWARLEERESSDLTKRARSEEFLLSVRNGHQQLHTACGRAFIELYDADRPSAQACYDAAVGYLNSKDPAIFRVLNKAG